MAMEELLPPQFDCKLGKWPIVLFLIMMLLSLIHLENRAHQWLRAAARADELPLPLRFLDNFVVFSADNSAVLCGMEMLEARVRTPRVLSSPIAPQRLKACAAQGQRAGGAELTRLAAKGLVLQPEASGTKPAPGAPP